MNFETYQSIAVNYVNHNLSIQNRINAFVIGISEELAEVLKEFLFTAGNVDHKKVQEELGDTCWNMAVLCDILGLNLKDLFDKEAVKPQLGFDYLLHAMVEAGEIGGSIRKTYSQGHGLKRDYIGTCITRLTACLWKMCHFYGYPLEGVLDMNVEKLKKRYPNGYFEEERSINR